MFLSASLVTAIVIQVLCQLYKVAYHSFKDRRLRFRWFFSAGGMPSAHTAFVTALSLSIGLNTGFDSEVFAVSLVFSVIVVYDILRLRSAVQRLSDILKKLVADRGEAAQPTDSLLRPPPDVGHTPAEVLVGALLGAAFAIAGRLLLGPQSSGPY